ncbi:MAG: sigma-54 dependent transcriptional regulator [Desulfotignum sp.]|nr:sigma-54 dependent transcriptional regulator [Desulfotignum sp.]
MTDIKKHILLVDDEERLLNSMAQRIALLGHDPVKATSGGKALELAKATRFDLAIVDLKMPDMDGLVTITKLKELDPDLRTVLLTGYGSDKTRQATEALGAIYFEKDAMGGLWDVIRQSGGEGNVFVIHSHQADTVTPLDADRTEPTGKGMARLIGETPEMQRLRKNIRRLSELDCPIVIHGEPGTGKELAARIIHRLSRRRDQRFLAFDCGCFSSDFRFPELVASLTPRPGDAPEPDFSGTILLDHIENMPAQTQADMLAILEENTPDVHMDVRFIVATQKSLGKKVSQGRFNRKLFQRLRAISIEMPSLRDRTEDIPMLCRYFLDRFNHAFQKNVSGVSDAVLAAFEDYAFLGNVRELQYIIERAVILAQTGTIEIQHLPRRLSVSKDPKSPALNESDPETPVPDDAASSRPFLTLQEMEHQHILEALKTTEGNKSRAAEILGISRAALWRKLRIISQKEA